PGRSGPVRRSPTSGRFCLLSLEKPHLPQRSAHLALYLVEMRNLAQVLPELFLPSSPISSEAIHEFFLESVGVELSVRRLSTKQIRRSGHVLAVNQAIEVQEIAALHTLHHAPQLLGRDLQCRVCPHGFVW